MLIYVRYSLVTGYEEKPEEKQPLEIFQLQVLKLSHLGAALKLG
jgi:hypothetical protein